MHDTDTKDLMVYGAERTPETVKLARMNLAVNGLRGEISEPKKVKAQLRGGL